MAGLHIHRFDDRILLCPASHARLVTCVEAYVPRAIRRFHAYLDGWELDVAYEILVLRVARLAFGDVSACRSCWDGTPCEEWVGRVQARLAEAWHRDPTWWRAAWDATEPQAKPIAEPDPPPACRAQPPRAAAIPPPRDVEQAAGMLGLKWPCAEPQLRVAFRTSMLASHPDLGGSDAAARRVLAARATIMKELEKT